MKLTLHEIAKVVGAKNDVTAYEDVAINQIEFDSRKITAGDLFLPLKGARDGHDFIQTAFDNGALATFTEKELPADQVHILVDDALEAFQKLAAYYLEKTEVDVIAVTGSNGKTTTKDMIHDILATTYRTYKTQGNYNNEIGLPYTALHMPDDTEKIVLEMGPMPFSVSHFFMTGMASFTVRPLRKSEFTMMPVSSLRVKASFSMSPPWTTSMMSQPNFLANSQSRSSWAGTAMMAPVP